MMRGQAPRYVFLERPLELRCLVSDIFPMFVNYYILYYYCKCTERGRGWSIATRRSLRSGAAKLRAALCDLSCACTTPSTSCRPASANHRYFRSRPANRRPSPHRKWCQRNIRRRRRHVTWRRGQRWRHVRRATRRRRPPWCRAGHVPCHVTSWRCCARSLPPRFGAFCRWRHHPSPRSA